MPNWNSVITDVSIPSTIAVYGNGKALNFTEGTNMHPANFNNQWYFQSTTNGVGLNVGDGINASNSFINGRAIGFLTASQLGSNLNNSGIVAKSNSITRTSKSFKFCIKY